MTNEPSDPLFDALSGLTPVAPRQSHDRRVRQRCHALFAERRSRIEASARSIGRSDMMSAAAVTLYIVAIVTEAVRLIGAAG
jgi:hypothetical protein